MKKICFYILLLSLSVSSFAEGKSNADEYNKLYSAVENVFESIEIPRGVLYLATDYDVEKLIFVASDLKINLFELFDFSYQYLNKTNRRIKMTGSSLVKLSVKYILADGIMKKLLPLDKIKYIEAGTVLEKEQNPLDVFFTEKYNADFGLGTGFYETHFGFKKIEPLTFSNCFGLSVKPNILNIRLYASKLYLYEKSYGAFYIRGFFKPKRWYFDPIKIK